MYKFLLKCNAFALQSAISSAFSKKVDVNIYFYLKNTIFARIFMKSSKLL